MNPPRAMSGFSLLEVIVAAGIFAGSVTLGIALLAGLVRQAGEIDARLTARRLPDAIAGELQRLAAGGFDAFASQVPELGNPLGAGLALVAGIDGTEVQSVSYRPATGPRLRVTDQYYLVECWRYPAEPLRFESGQGSLALHVRISWPYHIPGSLRAVPPAERSELAFPIALNR